MPHTPLPWFAFEGECTGDPCIGCETGTIAVCEGNEGEAEANAEFIVKAVNSHDDLLDACKEVVGVLGRLPSVDPLISDAHTACKRARAAIAKAEGQQPQES